MSLPAPAPLTPATSRPTAPPPSAYFLAALAYLACSRLSAWGTVPTDQFAPVWLGTGLSIWLIIRFGPRMLIGILLGELASNALDYEATTSARDLLFAAPMVVGNLLTAYVGARVWHRGQERWREQLGGFSEPLCCVVAALVAPLVATTIGVSSAVLKGSNALHQVPNSWLAWWTADAMGALFLLPVLTTAPDLWQRLRHPTRNGFGRAVLLFGCSAFAIDQIFGPPGNGHYLFVLFPLLAMATAWFGAPGARLLAVFLAAAGTYAARHGHGPFPTGQIWADLLTVQLFLSVIAVLALLLPVLHARKNLLEPLPRTLLLGGWALSGLVFGFLLKAQLRSDAADFGQLAFNAEASIENRMLNYVAVLRRAESYVLGAPAVSREGWGNFVQSLNLPTNYPGLRGVGLVYPVPPVELEDFLKRARADVSPNFTLHPFADEKLSSGQPHFILTHIVMVAPINQEPLGLDVGSQAQRRRTLEAARDSGQPQIAPSTNRTQAGSGFVLYLPIYAAGAPLTTVAERRAAFRAWVHAPFINHELMKGALGARSAKLHLHLFAAGPLDPDHLIYTTAPTTALPPFERIHSRRLLGQEFTLAWTRRPAFVLSPRTPLIWLAASLSLGTVLLTGWVLSLQSFRERAETLVTERTAALLASENRYRLLNRAANVGLWEWDLVTGSLYFSPEWKGQIGYADHELPAAYETWESRLHPADRAATLAAVADFRAGRRPTYDVEFRLRHRDGSWRWILTQAELAHDATGRVVRMTGSHIDITARKATETALRASDQRFNDLVNSTDGIVWEADATTFAFTSVSTNAQRLLGYAIADWLQPGFWAEHIHPDDREQAVQFCAACTGRAEDHDFEYRFTAADGRILWLRDIVRVVLENNQPRWLRGLMIDITAQKMAQMALRESESRFRTLIEHSPYCIHEINLAGRLTSMNTAGLTMMGVVDFCAIQDMFYLDAVGPPDRERVAGLLTAAIAGQQASFAFQAANGTEFQSSFIPITNEHGSVDRLMGLTIDITEQKRAGAALRSSEAKLRALIAAIPDLVFEQGRNGEYLGIHASNPALLLADPDKLLRSRITDFLPAPIAHQALAGFGTALDTGETQILNYTLTLHRVDQHFEARIAKCTAETVLVIVRDITERHTVEMSLQSSLVEKTALLKEVHHRVKNNLQVITSLLRLESSRSTVADTKGVLTAMQSRIRAMALLHESLYQSGTFAAVDLGAYLRNIATQSFRMLNTSAGSVRLTLDLAPFSVELDQAAPCGLLVNELISNSLKHGFPAGRGGEVRISLQPVIGSKQVCLRVSDDGIGLPPDFVTRCGASLGLQLVSDLTEQLNGRLEIGPAPAAVFTVTFTPITVKGASPA